MDGSGPKKIPAKYHDDFCQNQWIEIKSTQMEAHNGTEKLQIINDNKEKLKQDMEQGDVCWQRMIPYVRVMELNYSSIILFIKTSYTTWTMEVCHEAYPIIKVHKIEIWCIVPVINTLKSIAPRFIRDWLFGRVV